MQMDPGSLPDGVREQNGLPNRKDLYDRISPNCLDQMTYTPFEELYSRASWDLICSK
jgi:hypothetical protein